MSGLVGTYTTSEVTRIFRGVLKSSTLQDWDRRGLLRPSKYYDRRGEGDILSPTERDARVERHGASCGDPERRYTYRDLVRIRLFLYVADELDGRSIPNPRRRASAILEELWSACDGVLPAASRLVFLDADVYLLSDEAPPLCLTRPDQQALDQVLMGLVEAEVRGRIAALHGYDAQQLETENLLVG